MYKPRLNRANEAWLHVVPDGTPLGSTGRLEAGPDEMSVRVTFVRSNGTKVKAYASKFDVRNGDRLLRVEILKIFKRIVHIRLPDGDHAHVSIELIASPDEVQPMPTVLARSPVERAKTAGQDSVGGEKDELNNLLDN